MRNLALAQRLESLENQVWEIRESEEIHRTLTEGFGDVVMHWDDDGTVSFTNSIYPLYFDADHPAPPPGKTGEMRLQTRQGERWFSWTESPVRHSDTGRSGVQAVGRDITDRREGETERQQALELARDAGAARARFLATMSHEMRTPLNGILGMNRLLEQTSLSAHQRDHCRAIGESGRVLLALVDDVLDTALVNEGRITLKPQEVALLPLVEGVGELLAARQRETARLMPSGEKPIESLPVGIFVDTACPEFIHADEKRLRQVLMNLMGNALKFTRDGGVGLFVEMAGPAIRFSVRDSGPGMAEADRERLFEPFEQANQSMSHRHGGAGLGLSIARHLVALMGGELVVDSAVGRGCAFSFALPVENQREGQAKRDKTKTRAPVALVMARSPARDALIKSITQQGHACHCFNSNAVFMAACQAGQWPPEPDDARQDRMTQGGFILLSHTHVTGQSEEVQKLRQHLDGFGLSGMKYISLTAASKRQIDGDMPLASQDRHAVFDGWLTWPVRQKSLKRVLRKSLTGSAPRQPLAAPPLAPLLPQETATVAKDPGGQVLLAEDNSINALLARSLLQKLGYDVTTVAHGGEALTALERGEFDLVLLDLHMPVMDGLETLKALRQREWDRGLAQMPVFMLSADNHPSARREAEITGATDFLLKPLDFDAVRDRLQAHRTGPGKSRQSA
ncbi:MAG: ATP-binding protein [Pseudomonadota bacterium]